MRSDLLEKGKKKRNETRCWRWSSKSGSASTGVGGHEIMLFLNDDD
jgi:hypothetical protein